MNRKELFSSNYYAIKSQERKRIKKGHRKLAQSVYLNKAKSMLKKAGVYTFCIGTSLFVVGCGYTVVTKVGAYMTALTNDMLNFEEQTYHQNPNVEPGYYNENPIKICIADNLDGDVKDGVLFGLRYLDHKAEGMKFDIYFADPDYQVYDVKICKANNGIGNEVLGYSTLGSTTSSEIKGWVYLNDEKLGEWDAANTIVHEMCHVFGIGHSKNPFSLMFPLDSRIGLSYWDTKTINTIYPDGDYKNPVDDSMEK